MAHQSIHSVSLLKSYMLTHTNVVDSAVMADARLARRVLVHVNNLLNQNVKVFVVGNIADSVTSTLIIKEFTCPTGEEKAYGLKHEEWMPYIGVQIQAWVAPTAGSISAVAIIQE